MHNSDVHETKHAIKYMILLRSTLGNWLYFKRLFDSKYISLHLCGKSAENHEGKT
jgi:hypothetical protein